MPCDKRRLSYLDAMGIRVWVPRRQTAFDQVEATDHSDAVVVDDPGPELSEADTATADTGVSCPSLDWEELEARVAGCTACPLHQGRTQTVFGVGNRAADWMVIGEAPGEQEDLQGEPFVGRAGQLLNEMIWAIGLQREAVYIANVIKCRPPGNRDPAPEETAACEHFLKQQVALIKPKIILAVGRIAAQNLLKTGTPIGKLRGRVHYYDQIPLVVTYHPAYLLRSQTEKRRAWEDLKLAMRAFRQQNR
ncbi:uracil-DNA glycosylase [Methylocaldum szegediense]|uniref:Type-4 uracil-DNA glycosylase n=1 Tax=Methylocaldum szegediense TaxID=73780 RepID=A0ABM9I046_9GAMM|nr:uracil-DNA glycosylase [Methylocaldum szegediense]CAI8802326.1 uracil-DNA glycosylase [Methylocaldum szegediense]